MSYIIKLYSGRIGSMAFLVGNLIATIFLILILEINRSFNLNVLIVIVELVTIFIVFIFILSLYVRRLHDCNKSGWFILLIFIPLVNAFFGLTLLIKFGNRDVNNYGNPTLGNKYILQDIFALDHF